MRTTRPSLQLLVRTIVAGSRRGVLHAGPVTFACAFGRSGISAFKREGDGATPRGVWRMREVLYRADRIGRPRTGLPVRALRPSDGWCDASGDRNYNRLVRHPYPASAEQLWREDGLYDVIVVLDHNHRPRVRGLGSAVFLHCAGDGLTPTAGCIAVGRAALVRMLARIGQGARVWIGR